MSLVVQIAAEFVGKKAFNQASKSTISLEKQAKKLGKSLTAALSVGAVVAFGKAAAKAFAEDEKAAIRLAKVVDNLGLSFANPEITRFIDKLTLASGVSDDKLRPALQALLTTTGNVALSQKLLSEAIDISAGSGIDLATVANDLAQAYVGNTRGLRKYNLGLTQAELKTASFAEIQSRLLGLFSGSNAAFLDTYAGKMQVLSIAAGEAQEIIGKGLLDAISILAGKETSVQDLADAFTSLATSIATVTLGLAGMIEKIRNIPGLKQLLALIKFAIRFSPAGTVARVLGEQISSEAAAARQRALVPGIVRSPREAEASAITASAKAQAAAAKRAAAVAASLAKAQKATTAELKKQALTKKQSALFDLDQIQLVAALKGNLSKEEEMRVKLQLALLTGNTTEADKLSKQLAYSIDATGKLAMFLQTLPEANNPFKAWDEWLKNFTKNLANVTGSSIPTSTGAVTPTIGASTPATNAVASSVFNNLGSANASTRTAAEAARLYGGMGSSQPTIVVQIDGKEIASAVQNQGLQGNNPIVDRLLGQFR